jgi:hypothetical protein
MCAKVFEHMETSIYGELQAYHQGLSPAVLKAAAWQLIRAIGHLHEKGVSQTARVGPSSVEAQAVSGGYSLSRYAFGPSGVDGVDRGFRVAVRSVSHNGQWTFTTYLRTCTPYRNGTGTTRPRPSSAAVNVTG